MIPPKGHWRLIQPRDVNQNACVYLLPSAYKVRREVILSVCLSFHLGVPQSLVPGPFPASGSISFLRGTPSPVNGPVLGPTWLGGGAGYGPRSLPASSSMFFSRGVYPITLSPILSKGSGQQRGYPRQDRVPPVQDRGYPPGRTGGTPSPPQAGDRVMLRRGRHASCDHTGRLSCSEMWLEASNLPVRVVTQQERFYLLLYVQEHLKTTRVIFSKIPHNKKVLLRERKRHIARRVASTRYAALSPDGGGGYPHLVLHRGTPTPIQFWWRVPPIGWMGYPPSSGWGTSHRLNGVPLPPPHRRCEQTENITFRHPWMRAVKIQASF